MKSRMIKFVAMLAIAASGSLFAQDPVSTVTEGCKAEIESYCSQVTAGEGRLLACFFAHEDKLSGQCQYALYSASAQLEHAISALNYVAGQCQNDMVNLCGDVQLGEGRVVDCLKSKGDEVSAACTQAMSDVFVE